MTETLPTSLDVAVIKSIARICKFWQNLTRSAYFLDYNSKFSPFFEALVRSLMSRGKISVKKAEV